MSISDCIEGHKTLGLESHSSFSPSSGAIRILTGVLWRRMEGPEALKDVSSLCGPDGHPALRDQTRGQVTTVPGRAAHLASLPQGLT